MHTNIDARTVPAEFMASGITLAQHYVAEALRPFEAGQVSGDLMGEDFMVANVA